MPPASTGIEELEAADQFEESEGLYGQDLQIQELPRIQDPKS